MSNRTCPVCSRVFEARKEEVFCRTSCRKKAGMLEKYRKSYVIGKV